MASITCSEDQCIPPTCLLPPGFRFHPTDEELITCYLVKKVADESFRDHAVTEVDLNKHEPWDLPEKAKMMGEKEWYFFSHKDRKYPSGSRINRATEAGYWKATGKDKEIFSKSKTKCTSNGAKQLVGMKKTLVFYEGRAPRGLKSNWVMHEYRVHERASIASILGHSLTKMSQGKKEWVLCRVIHKKKLRLSKRDQFHFKVDDAILNDAELLARFVLADDQKLPESPLNLDQTSPLNLAGIGNLEETALQWGSCSSLAVAAQPKETSTSSELTPSRYSTARECYSSFSNNGAAGVDLNSGMHFPSHASFNAPLPRFPSELESFWLHAASAFFA